MSGQQVLIDKNKWFSNEIYRQLICVLEYETSPYYRPDEKGIYDYCYYVEIETIEYPIIGIKLFDVIDEDAIIRQHLLYWNRNDVPISILVFPEEFRIYNNFTCKNSNKLLYSSKKEKVNNELLNELKSSKISTAIVWERLSELSGAGERVDKQLLFNLKTAVIQAHTRGGMLIEDAYNFMSQCIFVKYLEDRKMVTEKIYKKWEVNSFTELLEKKIRIIFIYFFLF